MQTTEQVIQAASVQKQRATIRQLVPVAQVMEGEGFLVNRPFPTRGLSYIDPFLLVDEFGPVNFKAGEAKGTGAHPHKGFEILSYILKGGFNHQDSLGNTASLGAGDVQWMTSGRGVIHKEQPIDAFKQRGGEMHGFQVWINLPAAKKNIEPTYQEIRASKIPTFIGENFNVKVLIGNAFGTASPIKTNTPVEYHHYTLQPNAELELAAHADHNTFLYPISGTLLVNDGEEIAHGKMPWFNHDGESVRVKNTSSGDAAEFIFFSGKPIGEPVARYGPFVMNTEKELEQAFMEYQSGAMGTLD
jgi:quercetin 2,3-dioxygenase